jgi:predicted RNA-binding Zn-ribbon protein involved in translation (DUF1610 family)
MVREVKETDFDVSIKKEREVFGDCPWCGAGVYRYEKKNDKGKIDSISYYCSDKCGFNLDTSNQTFIIFLGRKITDSEARRFISKGTIVLGAKNTNVNGTYRGEFTFKERISGDVKYCNIRCERAKSKAR